MIQILSVFTGIRKCRKLHVRKILTKLSKSSQSNKDSTNTHYFARQFQWSAGRVVALSLLILQHQVTMQTLLTRPRKTSIETTAVLQPQGSLSGNHVAWFLRQVNAAMACEDHSSLVVDMNQVDLIDSEGLMAIVHAVKSAQKFNKRFYLCSVSRSVGIVLELARLDGVLEVFESLPQFKSAVQIAA